MLEGDVVETEAEGVSLPESSEDVEPSEPQPRPETEEEMETCKICGNVKRVADLCPSCGHVEGEEVPYDVPEAVEDPEDVGPAILRGKQATEEGRAALLEFMCSQESARSHLKGLG